MFSFFRQRSARWSLLVLALGCVLSLPAAASDGIYADGFEFFVKISQPDVEIALADDPTWTSLKANCDADLNSVITDIYAGFDWRAAAQNFGLCYNVGVRRGDPKALTYSKKAAAVLKTLARSFPLIAPNQNHQFIGFGDGSTRAFALPMTPLAGTTVRVFTNTSAVSAYTYSATPLAGVTQEFSSAALYPVLRISSISMAAATSNAAPEYTKEVDWHVSLRDEVNGDSAVQRAALDKQQASERHVLRRDQQECRRHGARRRQLHRQRNHADVQFGTRRRKNLVRAISRHPTTRRRAISTVAWNR